MICYYYPPFVTAGTERSAKFAKYLPLSGYVPHILTTTIGGAGTNDSQNSVHRATELLAVHRRVTKRVSRSNTHLSNSRAGDANEARVLRRIKSFLLEWMVIPDAQIGWFPSAVRLGRRMLRHNDLDLIYSSSPPETSHLIACCLSHLTGRPLVADFRDGWAFESLKTSVRTNRYRRSIEGALEKTVVRSSDAIITASPPITEYFRHRYGLPPTRAVTITNGYDPEDYVDMAATEPPSFTITHTGTFSKSRSTTSPYWFFQAIHELLQEHQGLKQELHITLVGNLNHDEKRWISDFRLQSVVHCVGQVSREESLRYQLTSTVLLLVTSPADRSTVTSKLFEYLAARKPILALAQGTAAAEILSAVHTGSIVSPTDVEAIKRAIIALYAQWEGGELGVHIDPAKLQQFDRRELTRQLAEVFDRVLARDESTPRRSG